MDVYCILCTGQEKPTCPFLQGRKRSTFLSLREHFLHYQAVKNFDSLTSGQLLTSSMPSLESDLPDLMLLNLTTSSSSGRSLFTSTQHLGRALGDGALPLPVGSDRPAWVLLLVLV